MNLSGNGIPQCNGKNSIQPFDIIFPVAHISDQNHFCITGSTKISTFQKQFFFQFLHIVDFTVKYNGTFSVCFFSDHGLLTGDQIDDFQPHMSQTTVFLKINPLIIRATALLYPIHGFQNLFPSGCFYPIVCIGVIKTGDTTHGFCSFSAYNRLILSAFQSSLQRGKQKLCTGNHGIGFSGRIILSKGNEIDILGIHQQTDVFHV